MLGKLLSILKNLTLSSAEKVWNAEIEVNSKKYIENYKK